MVLENGNTVAIHYFVEDVVSWMTTWNVYKIVIIVSVIVIWSLIQPNVIN